MIDVGSRRAASARVREKVTAEGVPTELLDMGSPHWQSEAACLEWLSKRGIRAPSGLSNGAVWNPYLALNLVITAWAIASGYSHPDFPRLPDQRFMVASGLARVQQDCTRQRLRVMSE